MTKAELILKIVDLRDNMSKLADKTFYEGEANFYAGEAAAFREVLELLKELED